ncbi:hypothetical protein EDB89DRAFT_1902903 [Lactarius sanguifluus]|nr:hypothetical protein EDB89DRAFT_1902903 [Lactarius sanguifluus]
MSRPSTSVRSSLVTLRVVCSRLPVRTSVEASFRWTGAVGARFRKRRDRRAGAGPSRRLSYLCILFAQLGRGVSVLLSTGDDGVGKNCKDESGDVRFVPEFPASLLLHKPNYNFTSRSLEFRGFAGPYLTAVGGTTDYDPEAAAPSLEADFRTTFHARSTTPPCPHSSSAKAPSILAPTTLSVAASLPSPPKLSCSQPPSETMASLWMARATQLPCVFPCSVRSAFINAQIVAGTISLLNDYLITNGRPPLGFLNIRLYDDGFSGLNDITSGSNPGCDTDGFSAVPGWDSVTGLGTPYFEKLQNIFMIPLGGGAGQGDQPKIHGPGE